MTPVLKCIGVSGQKQNGKDTLANYLALKLTRKVPIPCHGGGRYEPAPWGRGSFAAAVKRIFCETFDKDLEFVEKWKTKDEPPPGMNMPVRQALVFIGDGFRKIQSDIWIETAFRPENDPLYKVYSDLRYINEARKIKSQGGMNILVYRENEINWDENGSEREILPYVLWCLATGREGMISEWTEFQQKKTWHESPLPESFRQHQDYNLHPIPGFWRSLPDSMIASGDNGVSDLFFDNLSQFDLFIRSADGVENVYAKVESVVLPYIHENYVVGEVNFEDRT